VTLTAGLQIKPVGAQQMSLRVPVMNAATGLPGIPTGGTAVISATGLPSNLSGWPLTINGARVDYTFDSSTSTLRMVVPGGTPLGPNVLRLLSPNGDPIAPILFNVDAPPPVIQAASGANGINDAAHPAVPGDVLTLDVTRLGSVPASGVHIIVGGVDHVATALTPVANSDVIKVQFTLASGFPDGTQQAMTVRVGTRVSAPFKLNAAVLAPAVKLSPRK